MMNTNDFIQKYHENMQDSPTCYIAYLNTETYHIEVYGKRRYASYNVFKAAKSRAMKQERNSQVVRKLRERYLKTIRKYVPYEEHAQLLKKFDDDSRG